MFSNIIYIAPNNIPLNVSVVSLIPYHTYTVVPPQSSALSATVSNIPVITGLPNQNFSPTPVISNGINPPSATVYLTNATATATFLPSEMPQQTLDLNNVYASSATAIATVLQNAVVLQSPLNINGNIPIIANVCGENCPTASSPSVGEIFPSHVVMNENSFNQRQALTEIIQSESINPFQSQPNFTLSVPTPTALQNGFVPVPPIYSLNSSFGENRFQTYSREIRTVFSPSMRRLNLPYSENGFQTSSLGIRSSFSPPSITNENYLNRYDVPCEPINLSSSRFRSQIQTASCMFNPTRENEFPAATPAIRSVLSSCLFQNENYLSQDEVSSEPINLAPSRVRSRDQTESSAFTVPTVTELSDSSEIPPDVNTALDNFIEEIFCATNHSMNRNLPTLNENLPSSSIQEKEVIPLSPAAVNNTKPNEVDKNSTSTAQSKKTDNKRKNKEIAEELSSAGGIQSDRVLDMPDGEETWRAFYDHPLSAATSAMLNIGGGTSAATEDSPASATTLQPSNPVGLLCEYYKLPLDKALVDKYGSLPDFWTSTTTDNAVNRYCGCILKYMAVPVSTPDNSSTTTDNAVNRYCGCILKYMAVPVSTPDNRAVSASGQASIIGSSVNSVGASVPVSVLPQAAELLRNRRLSDANELTPQEVDIYLNRGLVKRESPDGDELVIPSTSAISSQKSPEIIKDSNTAKTINNRISPENPPVSPLPSVVQIKREQDTPDLSPSSPTNNSSELPPASTVIAQAFSSHVLTHGYEPLASQYTTSTLPQYQNQSNSSVYMLASNPDYRGLTDYYTEQIRQNLAASASSVPTYTDATDTASLVDRYIRQAATYKGISGLTVDLSSPDSGIGETSANHREASGLQQTGEIFDYPELSQAQTLLQSDPQPSRPSSNQSGASRRSWHEYGRNSESDKVNIPKIHSDVGFRYFLESPISTSQRREDDRITYINKGQFYGITLEYITDSAKPLKSSTVKSVVMLMFREEKPPDEELKAWRFWHSRQHSLKQRILDADTKNSTGIIGQIEEVAHNAIAFFWNPLEAPAKVNIAVQCLSTDFSNQKGVKGLPLHLQIDTFDDFREGATPHHRGYCQIKVFCDKGAERKTRDEERRAAKRKLNTPSTTDNTMTFPGRKKIDELYHLPCDRSEFYSMSDLLKPPILFSPCDDIDKMTSMDLTFYSTHSTVSEDPSTSGLERLNTDSRGSSTFTPPPKRMKHYPGDRVLLYARQESEEAFQPLHIYPPTLAGLAKGIENKYSVSASNVRKIFKRNKKGITVQMDDDIIKHYCNEDTCLIEVTKVDSELCDITLVEI